MKQYHGRFKGHYIPPRSTPDIAVLRANSSFSDRVEAFLESACMKVSAMSMGQMAEMNDQDQPLLVCLIGESMDESLYKTIEELREQNTAAQLLLFLRQSTYPQVTRAMRMGVFDVLVEPIEHQDVMRSVNAALDLCDKMRPEQLEQQTVRRQLAQLTPRLRTVLDLLMAGLSNRKVAASLGISAKAVERNRQQLKEKLQARTFTELVRKVAAAQAGARGGYREAGANSAIESSPRQVALGFIGWSTVAPNHSWALPESADDVLSKNSTSRRPPLTG